MDFKIGDKVIYMGCGVATVERLESRVMGDSEVSFYVLRVLSSATTVLVPVASALKAGLRNLLTKEEIEGIYHILQGSGKISQTTWNRRFREFNEKLRTGSIFDASEVLRDLHLLQRTKPLSFGEKKLLEKSYELVLSEIHASSENTERTAVDSRIKDAIQKSTLKT